MNQEEALVYWRDVAVDALLRLAWYTERVDAEDLELHRIRRELQLRHDREQLEREMRERA